MNAESIQNLPGDVPATRPLSVRFPLVVVLLYWCIYAATAIAISHMFPRFLIRLAATLVCGLLMLVWWLRVRRFQVRTRWGVVALLIAGGVAATLLLDHTVMPPIAYMWSIPLAMTLGALWLTFSRNASPNAQVLGLCGVIIASWLPGPLVRMEGLNGDGSNDVYWRWSPTAEAEFLQQLPATAEVVEVGDERITEEIGDWPQFRGPAGNDQVPELAIATDWDKTPPKLLWKHAIGPAWSSIIVIGDRLVTQEQRGDIESITCYAAASGNQLWTYDTKDRFEESLGGVGPRATPAFAEGRIYALSARGRLDCVDARDGKLVWTVDALKDQQGRLPMWGYSISPLVVDGKAIVFLGGETNQSLAAYDAETGSAAWSAAAGVESYSSPLEVTIYGTKQVLYLGDSKLVSVDPQSGMALWEHASDGRHGRPTCQPQLVGDDRLLISFTPDDLVQIEVSNKNDVWSTREIWRSRDIKPDYSDYLVHDGFIYGFDGNIFCCVDLETGERRWKKGRYGAGQALLLPDMPAILITSEQGELVLLECNPEEHVELARMPAIDGKTWNHQAISRGRLYVRNAEEIACFELPVTGQAKIAAR